MRNFICILILFKSISVYAQDGYGKNDSLRASWKWYNSTMFTMDIGVSQFDRTLISIGGNIYKQNVYSYYNHRLAANFNLKGAVGFQYQFNITFYTLCLGASIHSYYYKNIFSTYLTPQIGFDLIKAKLVYGYRVNLNNGYQPEILNQHMISLYFGEIFWQKLHSKKKNYKRKYWKDINDTYIILNRKREVIRQVGYDSLNLKHEK